MPTTPTNERTPIVRAWWNLACWNGLSEHQQRMLIERGGLEFGYQPMGTCQGGAHVTVECDDDPAPGPRFYCRPCAIAYLTDAEATR